MKKKKKKSENQILDAGLGAGYRQAYLDQNPTGFSAVHKTHKNKKKYSKKDRRQNSPDGDYFF